MKFKIGKIKFKIAGEKTAPEIIEPSVIEMIEETDELEKTIEKKRNLVDEFMASIPETERFQLQALKEAKAAAEVIKEKKPKAPKAPKIPVRELAMYDIAPEGMDQKHWEMQVCMEKLSNVFMAKNKERFGTEILFLTGREKAQLKTFYTYFQSFEKTIPLINYVFDEWWGLKPRYRIGSEFPTAGLFATAEVIKQIANEFHKKTNATREDIVYDW